MIIKSIDIILYFPFTITKDNRYLNLLSKQKLTILFLIYQ
jgi:hypothetical protein